MSGELSRLKVGDGDAAWSAWDRFVAHHADAAFCHLSGHLEALTHLYGDRVEAVMLRRGGEVRGVLACVRPRGGMTVSLPFYEYGGPLLACDAAPDEWRALLAAIGPAELRIATGWRGPDDLVTRTPLNDFAVLPLHDGFETVLDRADRQVRKAVRKAVRDGVRVVENGSAEALRRQFWPAYLEWMRTRHGTPPLPLAYWETCRQRLGRAWRLFQAWHGGRPVAQLLGFAVGPRVVITTIVSDEARAWPVRAVDAVHAAFVDAACREGYASFDFGSARYEGQRRYKAKWGCRFATYERVVYPAGPPAQPALAAESRQAALARAAWRCLPVSWTAVLGPPLRERLTR